MQMKAEREELAPGIALTAIRTGKFKSGVFSATLMVPLAAETAAEYAVLPSVLRRGFREEPTMRAISARLDGMYGGAVEPEVRKWGETQCVGFAGSFLDEGYVPGGEALVEPAADLLGKLLLDPVLENGVLSADYVRGERENLLHQIKAQRNDKMTYAGRRLTEEMCAGEAYAVSRWGDEAHAVAIEAPALTARWREALETSRIELYYCGSAEFGRVRDALLRSFSSLSGRRVSLDPQRAVRAHAAHCPPHLVREELDVAQGKLCLGFRTGGISLWSEDYPALLLLNALLGGTTDSKLFRNVREKLSLCYYAFSTLAPMKGLLMISSGIEPKNFDRAREEILAQVEACRRGDFTAEELESARRSLLNGFRSKLDAQASLENHWVSMACAGKTESPEELSRRVAAVTAEETAQAAGKLELDTVYFLTGREG